MLSPETLNQLALSKVDQGATFLVGKMSADANSTNVAATVGGALSVVGGAANIVGSGVEAAGLIANIVAEGLQKMTMDLTNCVAESTAKMMAIPMDKFTESFNNAIKTSVITPKEALAELSKSAEKNQEDKAKESEENDKNEIKNKASEKVKEITKTVNDALAKASKELNSIAEKIDKGPDWMEKEIDKYSKFMTEQVYGNVAKALDDFNQTKEEWAKKAGEAAAQATIEPMNKKIKDAQKKALDAINREKTKLINKAKALAEKAIMKIKGLLGG